MEMELPKQINNINERVVDDLKTRLSASSRICVAAASFSIYALFKVNTINNCRRKFNYSLAFKLETISIVLIFLANNLFITYETRTVPMIAYT